MEICKQTLDYLIDAPQGACGTCASSQATMKMGIERALKSKFGDAIKDIIQVACCFIIVSAAYVRRLHLRRHAFLNKA